VLKVEVGGGARGLQEGRGDFVAVAEGRKGGVVEGGEEFEEFGEAEDGPGEAAGPGGEAGVTLLGVGAAEVAVVDIEEALVGGAAPQVVAVAALAVEDGIAGGGTGVVEEASQEGDFAVSLVEGAVSEEGADGERAAGAERIDEERLRAVEGVDEAAAVGGAGPLAPSIPGPPATGGTTGRKSNFLAAPLPPADGERQR